MASSKKSKKKAQRPPPKRKDNKTPPHLPLWIREGLGIALIGCALFLFLSLFSYSPESDPGLFKKLSPPPQTVQNLGGTVGAYLASFLKEIIGIGAYFVGAIIALLAIPVVRGKSLRMAPYKFFLGILILIWLATLFSLIFPNQPSADQGGIIGHWVAARLLEYLNPAGSYLSISMLLILSIIAFGEIALLRKIKFFFIQLIRFINWNSRISTEKLQQIYHLLRKLSSRTADLSITYGTALKAKLLGLYKKWRKRSEITDKQESSFPKIINNALPVTINEADNKAEEQTTDLPKIVDPKEGLNPLSTDNAALLGEQEKPKPVQASLPFPQPLPQHYRPPPLTLLDNPDPDQAIIDEESLQKSAVILENKLKDFGVLGKVLEIHPGPVITLFEYEPASGIKVNRIVNLADDLALALKALSIRIVAPIPGKAVVGIEVPNPKRQTVSLKDILADKVFHRGSLKLPLALGKDIAGKPVMTDLSRMPHLLIAGATGTGKSVNLHSLILSILFRFSPQEVKFLMIDPKMLELSAYHGIPHLLHPVITDSRRAPDVLEWAVERMEQRYQLLSEKGVRNIESYNERIEKELAAAEKAQDNLLEDHSLMPEAEELEDDFLPEQGKLPYIILVIDEMADLMIVAGRQIEESITRLAQMARAAGIHLLLATQRPSVDVLTGIIKANLPARISFQVSSRIDSRTILDSMGAEKLLGRGDMLFLPPGTSRLRRIHGAFVSEPEIERIVEYIKRYGKPEYEKIPFKEQKGKEKNEAFDHDEKYDLAVQLVAESRHASISMIQRKLRVGYNRAARMIERMEQEGVVGPQEGVRPREVLINNLE